MKIRALTILLATFATACANQNAQENVLQAVYGDKIESFGGITFLKGPWYAPGSEYGYRITDGFLYIAHQPESGHDKHIIKISDCPKIETGIKEIEKAIFDTAKIFAGVEDPAKTDVIVMDGPSYRLEYYSDNINGSILLEGGENSSLSAPWVNAALQIGDIASACE